MVFTNLIMFIHVNRTANQPLMSSIATEGTKIQKNPRKGYWEPFVITTRIPNHRNGHFVRPKKVALKYPNFKKDVVLDVHVKVFNYVVRTNEKTSKECIINVFSYMLRDITLDQCHNYMSKFQDNFF